MDFIQKLLIWAIPVLYAITLHEVAHGYVAFRLGDPTAKMLGRINLNPLKHVDPIGTIVVPLCLLYLGGFLFGWAKPVPVNFRNLKHSVRDPILVACAGPLSNFLMALFWAFISKLGYLLQGSWDPYSSVLMLMGEAGIMINVLLMVLNLIPIPPLDGSRVVSVLLPGPLAWQYNRLEPYGFIILIALMVTGILGKMMMPGVMATTGLIFRLFQI